MNQKGDNMKNIILRHKVLGYDNDLEPVEIIDELFDVGDFLSCLFDEEVVSECSLKYYGNIKSDVKKILDDNSIKLHDVFVENKNKMKKLLKEFFKDKIENGNYLINQIKDASVLKSPYDIPLKFLNEDIFYGGVVWRMFPLDDEDFLNKVMPVYKDITLSHKKNKISVLSYIHEIIHTQLESNKGIIKKYYHSELLPIFFEKVASLKKDPSGDLLRINNLIRYYDVLTCLCSICEDDISFENTISYSSYIVSTLKAEKLFDIYLNSNSNDKKLIMNKIQSVLDGRITLESLLDELDITLKNSSDVKILKKHI